MMILQRCLRSSMVHAQDSWTLFYFQNCYWWCWSINENVNNFTSSDELASACMVSGDGWNSDQKIIPAALWWQVLLHVGTMSFCDRRWFEIKYFTKLVRWLNPYRLLSLTSCSSSIPRTHIWKERAYSQKFSFVLCIFPYTYLCININNTQITKGF